MMTESGQDPQGIPNAPENPPPQPPKMDSSDHSFGGDGFMMGGNIGDGALPEDIQHQQMLRAQGLQQPVVPGTPAGRSQPTPMNTPFTGVVPAAMPNMNVPQLPQLQGTMVPGATYGMQQQQQQQQQQAAYGNVAVTTPTAAASPSAGGSSYAARSAALVERHQQQPQMQPSIMVSPASTQPPGTPNVMQGAMPNAMAGQFQTQQMQQQQYQQPQMQAQPQMGYQFQNNAAQASMMQAQAQAQPTAPNVMASAMGGSSYAQRSQLMQQGQMQVQTPTGMMQQQPNQFQPSQQIGTAPTAMASPSQQQGIMSRYAQQVVHGGQQPQSQMQQQQAYQQGAQLNMQAPNASAMAGRPPAQAAAAGGSYAARSAALASAGQPQAQPQMQQQQQQYQQPQLANSAMMNSSMYGNPQAQPVAASMQQQQQVQQTQTQYQPQMQGQMQQQQQQPQQQQMQGQQMQGQTQQPQGVPPHMMGQESPAEQAHQQRLLMEATRKVQEHAYYMKQAMERHDLPNALDRAASMVGELGEQAHAHHSAPSPGPPIADGMDGSAGIGRARLNPKTYYELHLRALDDLPVLEDYLKQLSDQGKMQAQAQALVQGQGQMQMQANQGKHYTMLELYNIVQYCPNVLSRLYMQICAASALIASKEVGAKWVMNDVMQAVKCVQNPVRGLFLRHYLLQAFRDKLPDTPEPMATAAAAPDAEAAADSKPAARVQETAESAMGNVKDSYEFILANFVEMNKLWVRIRHLPGDGKSREIRRRRERERNELKILVGTNLIRLSQLECVTSKIYGELILPRILEHIVVCNDPLAQAYVMDCITQVFPDEYHLETMPILLGVCPRLRDRVNIRTILNSMMERLANYLADEELLDEKDSNSVKSNLARDSFEMFHKCVQSVFNARGPKLSAKEAIRLQTALVSFTMKCNNGNQGEVVVSLGACVQALNQARTTFTILPDGNMATTVSRAPLDDVATSELEKLLSIPMDSLALGVLKLDHFSNLIAFLPWSNRRQVAITLLEAINNAGSSPQTMDEIEELFEVIAPVIRDENSQPHQQQQLDAAGQTAQLMAGLGVSNSPYNAQMAGAGAGLMSEELRGHNALVSKLIHLLDHENTDMVYGMLSTAKRYISVGGPQRVSQTYVALIHAALDLAKRIVKEQRAAAASAKDDTKKSDDVVEAAETKTEAPGEAKEGATEETKQAEIEATEEIKKESGEDTAKPEAKETAAEGEEKANEEEEAEPPMFDDIDDEKVGDDSKAEQEKEEDTAEAEKSVSARDVFVFIQQTIAALAASSPETAIKLYHETARYASGMVRSDVPDSKGMFGPIANELFVQSFTLYQEKQGDYKFQGRCIKSMVAALLACNKGLEKAHYEKMVMKACTFAAKSLRKEDQCELVMLCSQLFYIVDAKGDIIYANKQRCLECLQRALKLADGSTSTNPSNLFLFVDLLEQYLQFFHKNNPSITAKYITSLVQLVKTNCAKHESSTPAISQAKGHFAEVVKLLKARKTAAATSEKYGPIELGGM